MKQVYNLCELCNLFEPEQFALDRCKKEHKLHPLKATVECEDFQLMFEYLYDLVEDQKEKVEDDYNYN